MKITVFIAFFLLVLTGKIFAQDTVSFAPSKLTHEMSPEELLRINEIGRGFVDTDPPTGPVRNVAEFDRMQGALVRYPFGIPVSLIKEMATGVMVTTIVANATQKATVLGIYVSNGVDTSHCNFLIAPTDSYWTRDYGPWFESDSANRVGIVDFPYNRPRPLDDEIPKKIAEMLGLQWYGMRLKTAGGNYMTDGMGISSSTDLVWRENDTMTHARIAQKVHDYLGIENYQVVPDPNLGSSIDHIDCWGKFLGPDKILIRKVQSSNNSFNALESAATYWASQISSYGTPYRVFRVKTYSDQPYTNSLIINNKVLLPFMGTSWDDSAKATYEAAMPGYTVTGFIALSSAPWLSTDALHCRVMGIGDVGILYIRHIPLSGVQPCDQNYTINADVIACSDTTVKNDSVLVWYSVNNGTFQALHMTYQSGNTYTGVIPRQNAGSTVKYYLSAVDNSNRRETCPLIGAADPFTFTTAYTNLVAIPDTLWYDTPNDAILGKLTQIHNYMSSAVSFDSVQMMGPYVPWWVDSVSVDLPHVMNTGDSVCLRIKAPLATKDPGGITYFLDSVRYTSNLGAKHIILMINQALLSGFGETSGPGELNLFPNPFTSEVNIIIDLQEPGNAEISILDLNGRLIRNIHSGILRSGKQSFIWNGKDQAGNKTAGGIYLCRLKTGKSSLVKRIVFIN